jgi:UDP-glucose:(heptosyl)LPS alpha-1,3-glucosyltransferase
MIPAGSAAMGRTEFAVVFPGAHAGGGVERVALELARFEAKRRTTCFVGERIDDPGVTHAPVRVPRLPAALRPLAFRRAARAALSGVEAATILSLGAQCPPGDVYWVQGIHAAWLADGGSLVCRGVPVPPAARRLLLRHQVLLRLEHDYFVNRRPRLVLCPSPREMEDLNRIYGVPRDIMQMMPNGYDGSLFSTERRDELRGEMRAAIGANPGDIVVLMVANEWHRKGLGVVLKAIARLPDPRVRIDLVGRRDPVDYRPVAARLGLAGRLHWHGASSDAGRFFAAADIFVLPTAYEPFGIVIVEAMASGLPAVVSKLAGAALAIDHGTSGLLLDDPRDADELSANLKLLLDPDRRARMGAAAVTAADGYEWGHVLPRLDSLVFGRQDPAKVVNRRG